MEAKTATEMGRFEEAAGLLAAVSEDARSAHARVRRVAPRALGYVPIIGRPVRAAQMLTRAVAEASDGAREALEVFPDRSPWSAGALDLAAVETMRTAAKRADARLSTALALARDAPTWPLPASVGRSRRELITRLEQEASRVASARRLLDVLPAIVGAHGPRRYFVVFQNPSELRGSGGLWGNHAFVDAVGGRVELGHFGRPVRDLATHATTRGPKWFEARYGDFGGSRDWRQMGMTPHFPTAATLAEANLASAPGLGPVDGVIAVDPVGLAALLRLTGPIRVAGWPDPIDADNVVRITLHDAYIHFDTDQQRRMDFLTEVVSAAWAQLRHTDVPMRPSVLRDLGDAVAAKRFIFHMTRAKEQRQIAAVNADGAFKGSHTFALVSQNTAPNKMDYWLKRRLSLTFRLREDGSAAVTARAGLRNGGSAEGQTSYVAGVPNLPPFTPGWQQHFVSLYMPNRVVDRGGLDDVPIGTEEEPGFVTASTYVNVAPLSEEEVRARFLIRSIWDSKRGIVRLNFRQQPTLVPDQLLIEVVPPAGWHVQPDRLIRKSRGRAVFRADLNRDVEAIFKLSRHSSR